jgi:hypothetical protein
MIDTSGSTVKHRRPPVAHGAFGEELQNLSEAVGPFADEPEPSDVETIAWDVETIAWDVETIASDVGTIASDVEIKLVEEEAMGKDDDVLAASVGAQRRTVKLGVSPEETLECP